jgi:hypothetical protein
MKILTFQLDIVASSQCEPFFNRLQIFLFAVRKNHLPVTINAVTPQSIQNHTK